MKQQSRAVPYANADKNHAVAVATMFLGSLIGSVALIQLVQSNPNNLLPLCVIGGLVTFVALVCRFFFNGFSQTASAAASWILFVVFAVAVAMFVFFWFVPVRNVPPPVQSFPPVVVVPVEPAVEAPLAPAAQPAQPTNAPASPGATATPDLPEDADFCCGYFDAEDTGVDHTRSR